MAQPVGDISAVALRIPPFYVNNPNMWFRQVEAQFAARSTPITADETKFLYVLAALDEQTACLMEYEINRLQVGLKYLKLP